MANRDTIYKELIQLDWEVKDQDEFFDKMTDKPVSYTHLDVYKRQVLLSSLLII